MRHGGIGQRSGLCVLLIEALAEAAPAPGCRRTWRCALRGRPLPGRRTGGRIAGTCRHDCANVTSPGGTTRAALDVLMAEHGLPEMLDRAVAAATARSRELAN